MSSSDLKEVSSLATLNEALLETPLSVPAASNPYLTLEVQNAQPSPISLDFFENKLKRPSSASSVFYAKVLSARNLCAPNTDKKVLEVTFDISEGSVQYEPGDAFGFFPINSISEVHALLSRISLFYKKDRVFKCSSSSIKKSVPTHLMAALTLEQIFLYSVEMRSVPKKVFLRTLAEYTSDAREKRRLLQLCSRQGSDAYQNIIRNQSLCLLDLLTAFPSCHPSLEVILEHLPCMGPRFYSVSSSPLTEPNVMSIAFSIIKFPKSECRHSERLGVCTGYLDTIVKSFLHSSNSLPLETTLENLSLNDWTIPVYKRTNAYFKLPDDIKSPLIMIGPGTGVAPFIGFLTHRLIQSADNENFGDYFLFFGCRNKDTDFIYKPEMQNFEKRSVVKKLYLSFSRDNCSARYVQDNIKLTQKNFVNYLSNPEVRVYVCGDAKNMTKNVFDCVVSVVENEKKLSHKEAITFVKSLQEDKRYLQDIWA